MKHDVKLLDRLTALVHERWSPKEAEVWDACGNVGQEQLRLDLDDSQPLDTEVDHESENEWETNPFSFYIRRCPLADFDAICPDACFEYQCCQFKGPD